MDFGGSLTQHRCREDGSDDNDPSVTPAENLTLYQLPLAEAHTLAPSAQSANRSRSDLAGYGLQNQGFLDIRRVDHERGTGRSANPGEEKV